MGCASAGFSTSACPLRAGLDVSDGFESEPSLLAMALALAFCAASCGRFVGWNRRVAVHGQSNTRE